MTRMRIYFLSTVPFAGTKEQEVIQPLATGLTLPTLLAVLMRAGLTHRSDPASLKLMVDLFLSIAAMARLLTSCRGPTRFPHPTSLPLLRLQVHTITKKIQKI